jgi:hypothetical protein
MEEITITSAQYITPSNIMITAVINGETLDVPLDPTNRHYAEIMRQVEAGTLTIADAD